MREMPPQRAAAFAVCVLLLLAGAARAGFMYVALDGTNNFNSTISVFSASGAQSTFATGLDYPNGMAFDSSGNLYVASGDSGSNDPIYKITPGGTVSDFVMGLNEPQSLVMNASGDLYAVTGNANLNTSAITKITPAGVVSQFVSGAYLSFPGQLAIDSTGNLYVSNEGSSETGTSTIEKISPTGVVSQFATGYTGLFGLALDSAGNLYAASATTDVITKFTSTGAASQFASGLNAPFALAFDGSGDLYSASNSAGTITEISPTGTRSQFASGLYQPADLLYQAPEPSTLGLLWLFVFGLSRRPMRRNSTTPGPSKYSVSRWPAFVCQQHRDTVASMNDLRTVEALVVR